MKRHLLNHSINLGMGRVAALNKLEKLNNLDYWKTILII